MSQIIFNNDAYDRARERAGLSHREIAAHLRLSPQALYNWRAGIRQPSLEHLIALARELEIDWRDLIKD